MRESDASESLNLEGRILAVLTNNGRKNGRSGRRSEPEAVTVVVGSGSRSGGFDEGSRKEARLKKLAREPVDGEAHGRKDV